MSEDIEDTDDDFSTIEYKHPSRMLSRLSGPSLFSFYPNVFGKRILIIGEWHYNDKLCDDISSSSSDINTWLRDIGENGPECLDIFVEDAYSITDKQIGGDIKPFKSGMYAIRHEFKGKIFDKIRYHYIDTRQFAKDNKLYKEFQIMKFLVKSEDPKSQIPKTSIDNLYESFKLIQGNLCDYLLGIDRSIENGTIFHNFMKKMIETSDLKYDIDNVQFFVTTNWNLIDKEFSKTDKAIDATKFKKTFADIFAESMSTYHTNRKSGNIGWMWDFVAQIMDIYTLSRMFMVFDSSKMSRGPINCRTYQKMKNIIFYGGKFHAYNYVKFINKYFNIEPKLHIDTGKSQCIIFNDFDFWEN
jgi:hypothetical protein